MSNASPADRQKMRELLEERKRKLEELKQKNAASPSVNTPEKSGSGNGQAMTPTTPSRPSSSVGGSTPAASVPASPASVLSLVQALVAPTSSTGATHNVSQAAEPLQLHSRVYRSQLSLQVALATVDLPPKEIAMHARGAQTDAVLLNNWINTQTATAAEPAAAIPAIAVTRAPPVDTGLVDDVEEDGDVTDKAAVTTVEEHDRELMRRYSQLESPSTTQLAAATPFIGFLKRTTPLVEHAMMLQDRFSLRPADLDDDASLVTKSASSSRSMMHSRRSHAAQAQAHTQQRQQLTLVSTLHDDEWTKDHEIYSICWNVTDPSRLLSVNYSHSTGSGLLEWNLDYDGKMESRHYCSSRVTTACYWHGLEPQRTVALKDRSTPPQSLIVAGSYTGQVIFWDMKAASYRPVMTLSHASLSSGISAGASPHQHPIYNIIPIDSHLFATADTMGLLAIWDMNKLHQPIEVLSLSWTAGATADPSSPAPTASVQQEVSTTALCFRDDNTFYVASEDGNLFQGQRHGEYRGLIKAFTKTHEASITSCDLHPSPSPSRIIGRSAAVSNNFSDLLLTGSADWSVALWSPRSSNAPLHRFTEFSDYVLDVRWSPAHPAVFAAADGSGTVSIWDLNKDLEVPVARNQASASAVNRLHWSPHTGDSNPHLLAGATHHGSINIYELSSELGMPSVSDWTVLDAQISSFLNPNQLSEATTTISPEVQEMN